jgi:low affinity Fe/Cu permease
MAIAIRVFIVMILTVILVAVFGRMIDHSGDKKD